MIRTIAFDADDTLWHNERYFRLTQTRFGELLADFAESDDLQSQLLAAEKRNLGRYGFGVKGFVLSMIETAVEVTEGRVPGHIIGELIACGQDMLAAPIEVLPDIQATLETLAQDHQLMVITKGDLLDQERKVAQSGLGDLFDGVEVVADKSPQIYVRIFSAFEGGTEHALMVGNSLRSDVLPALEAGSWAIHVPHDLTWEYEQAETPDTHPKFREIKNFGALPDLIPTLRHQT